MDKKTLEHLMSASGKSKSTIYALAKKLGRQPTVEELKNQKH